MITEAAEARQLDLVRRQTTFLFGDILEIHERLGHLVWLWYTE